MPEQTKLSLIDNIVINVTDLHCTMKTLLEEISDHLPNFLIAGKLNENFTKFDSKKLAKEINDFIPAKKINEKYDFFRKNIMKVINNNPPVRKQ